jgi:hypothetical protein
VAIALLPQKKQVHAIYLKKSALETKKKELIGCKYVHK